MAQRSEKGWKVGTTHIHMQHARTHVYERIIKGWDRCPPLLLLIVMMNAAVIKV